MTDTRRPISRKLRHWIPLPIAIFAVVGSVLQLTDFENRWDGLAVWTQIAVILAVSTIVLNMALDRPRSESD